MARLIYHLPFGYGAQNMKEPSFKNMLLSQINRLNKSNDLLDKQLRSYLINLIKEEKISPEAAYEKAIDKKIFADLMEEPPNIE